jgi:hypothetical protein
MKTCTNLRTQAIIILTTMLLSEITIKWPLQYMRVYKASVGILFFVLAMFLSEQYRIPVCLQITILVDMF